MASDDAKLHLLHGNETEYPEQYQFLFEAVCTVKQNTDDEVKKGQLAMTLQGRALDWFMKFVKVPTGASAKTLVEVRKGLIDEFRKSKYEA